LAEKIAIAVLGCSSIANRSVIPAIIKSDNFDLTHVASRSRVKADQYAKRFGCEACGYHDVFDDEKIEAVYVSLPVGLHYDWGLRVVQEGKHLIMDKTFTEDIEQTREILALSERKNTVCMEALAYVYHPVYQKSQDMVHSGVLGKIRNVEAFFGFPFLPEDDIRNSPELGGGAMLDALIYPLSFALNTVDRDPISFKYNIIRDEGQRVDSRGFVQINWDDCSAQIGYGFGFAYRNTFSVWGENASLHVNRGFSRQATEKGSVILKKQDRVEEIEIYPADQFMYMLNAFADKIAGTDTTGVNENANILGRMGVISSMRECYIINGKSSIDG